MSEREYEHIAVRAGEPCADSGAERWELRFESSPAVLVVRLSHKELQELNTHIIQALFEYNQAEH